jgi:thiosulfate/3-mercaptopyruvate sulfurtransferase
MDYLGIPAAMLDGGLAAWKRENRPLQTDTITPTAATTLTITAHPEVLISMVNLHASLNTPTVSLIDARLPEFHTGANKGMMVRAGRIPGAKNVPFPTLLRDSGTFRSFEELREQFGNAPTLVTYCHIGQQTTVPYFAARLAGRKRGEVKLYDGSFQEWSGNAEMPVTVDPQ